MKCIIAMLVVLLSTVAAAEDKTVDELVAEADTVYSMCHDRASEPSFNPRECYAGAVEGYKKVVELDPENTFYLIEYGDALRSSEKYNEAIQVYNEVIAVCEKKDEKNTKEYYMALVGKSDCLNSLKKYDAALAAANKAISITSNYMDAWIQKGIALNGVGRIDEAYEASIKGDLDSANWRWSHNSSVG